jgi:hypothetical protein
MFTEKERNQLNRFLSNQTFTCSAAIMDMGPEPKYEFEYRFKIVGEKKMMSVGEYYMYNIVDVEIIGIDEKYKTLFKILGRDFDKPKLENLFFKNNYRFTMNLNGCVSGELLYFDEVSRPRVTFNEIVMTNELYDDIMNKDTA